jgi:predicted HTH domain antitoxin
MSLTVRRSWRRSFRRSGSLLQRRDIAIPMLAPRSGKEYVQAPGLQAKHDLGRRQIEDYTLFAMRAVTIEIPENILVGSGQSSEEFAREAKLLLLAKLFELGRVSSGKAAEVCGMTRVEFLLSMGKLGVSLVQLDSDELKREIADA